MMYLDYEGTSIRLRVQRRCPDAIPTGTTTWWPILDVTVELGTETFEATATPVSLEERDRIYPVQAERYPGFAEYEIEDDAKDPGRRVGARRANRPLGRRRTLALRIDPVILRRQRGLRRRVAPLGGPARGEQAEDDDQGARPPRGRTRRSRRRPRADTACSCRGRRTCLRWRCRPCFALLADDEVEPDPHGGQSQQLEESLQHGLNLPRDRPIRGTRRTGRDHSPLVDVEACRVLLCHR